MKNVLPLTITVWQILLGLALNPAICQTPTFERYFGGSGSDVINSIAFDGSHYYLAGHEDSYASSFNHGMVLRLDTMGVTKWIKSHVDCRRMFYVKAVWDDQASKLILSGFALDNNYSALADNSFRIRLDSIGVHQSSLYYGGNNIDEVLVSSFASPTSSKIYYESANNWDSNNNKFIITKIDSNDNPIWMKRIRFAYNYNHERISDSWAEDPNRLMFAGSGWNINPSGGETSFLCQLDSMGNHRWSKTYTFPYTQIERTVKGCAIPGGGSLVALKVNTGQVGKQIIMRLNHNGVPVWTKIYTSHAMSITKIIALKDSNFLAIGAIRMPNRDLDGFYMKLNAQGNIIDLKTYGGSGVDVFRDVLLSGKRMLFAGYSQSSGTSSNDGWVVQTDSQGILNNGCFFNPTVTDSSLSAPSYINITPNIVNYNGNPPQPALQSSNITSQAQLPVPLCGTVLDHSFFKLSVSTFDAKAKLEWNWPPYPGMIRLEHAYREDSFTLVKTVSDPLIDNYSISLSGEGRHYFRIIYQGDNGHFLISNVVIANWKPITKFDLSLSPNPAPGAFSLTSPTAAIQSIELYDLTGRRLPAEISHDRHEAQVRSRYRGLALVKVLTEQGMWVQKVRME